MTESNLPLLFQIIHKISNIMLASLSRSSIFSCKQITRIRPLTVVSPSLLSCPHIHTSLTKFEKEPVQLEEKNFVQKLYNKIFSGVPVAKLRSSGYILLTHCAQRPDVVKFFEVFKMPDTFYSWFLVTELHVWLLGVSKIQGVNYFSALANSI